MKNTARLRRRILDRSATVAVVGQGYVGLSVACAAACAGFDVVGVDTNPKRVSDLRSGDLTVPGVPPSEFADANATGRLSVTDDHGRIAGAEVILITVPTPIRDGSPDLSFVEQACREVAANLRPGRLVILESTTYPGTSEQLVRPLLEESGLASGRDFLLAYSPERIDPGNEEFVFRNTPRIVGGLAPEATGIATLFYEQIVDKVIAVSSSRAAEFAKLLENTFRHVNIALVNEIAMLSHEMDIDVWEVLDAAASKPFGFMPFYPGPGVGGHCIPLDPTYLAWQARREAGRHIRILEQAEDVNAQMPVYVAARIAEAMNDRGMAVKDRRVLVLGVTYKRDVGDTRESPAFRVIHELRRRGALVSFHDPFVEEIEIGGAMLERMELSRRALAAADCVVLLTPHTSYDLEWIIEQAALLFDATNALGLERRPNLVAL